MKAHINTYKTIYSKYLKLFSPDTLKPFILSSESRSLRTTFVEEYYILVKVIIPCLTVLSIFLSYFPSLFFAKALDNPSLSNCVKLLVLNLFSEVVDELLNRMSVKVITTLRSRLTASLYYACNNNSKIIREDVVRATRFDISVASLMPFTNNLWASPLKICVGLCVCFFYSSLLTTFVAATTVLFFVEVLSILEELHFSASESLSKQSSARIKQCNLAIDNFDVLRKCSTDESVKQEIFLHRKAELKRISRGNLIYACLTMASSLFSSSLALAVTSSLTTFENAFSIQHSLKLLSTPVKSYYKTKAKLVQYEHAWIRLDKLIRVDPKPTRIFSQEPTLPSKISTNNASLIIHPEVTLKKGLNIFYGPRQSGKSLFISYLNGELDQLPTGPASAKTEHPVLLFNDSIRSNIIFGSEFDEARYSEVFKICGLDADFPDDSRSVGPSGTFISGGQRSRIGLARALYSRHPMVLLDDTLSTLDTSLAESILVSLASSDRYIVLTTSNPEYILEESNGCLIENGTITKHTNSKKLVKRHEELPSSESTEEDSPLPPIQKSEVSTNDLVSIFMRNLSIPWVLINIVVSTYAAYAMTKLDFKILDRSHILGKAVTLFLTISVSSLVNSKTSLLFSQSLFVDVIESIFGSRLNTLLRNSKLAASVCNEKFFDIDLYVVWHFFELINTGIILLVTAFKIATLSTILNAIFCIFAVITFGVLSQWLKKQNSLKIHASRLQLVISGTIQESIPLGSIINDYGVYPVFNSHFDGILTSHNSYIDQSNEFPSIKTRQTMVISIITAFVPLLASDPVQASGIVLSLMKLMSKTDHLVKAMTDIKVSANSLGLACTLIKKLPHQNYGHESISGTDVQFKDFSISFDDVRILSNINHTFKPKTKTLIIGRSGSGKSSLVASIKKCSGDIWGSLTLGGIPLEQISKHSLDTDIFFAPHNPIILNDTLTPEQESFLQEVGSDSTSIDSSLSTAQLLRFSELLTQNPKIVILDEFNSSLDIKSQKLMNGIISQLDSTVISIAHHLEGFQMYDEIIIMNQGAIVAHGTPEEMSFYEPLKSYISQTKLHTNLSYTNLLSQ